MACLVAMIPASAAFAQTLADTQDRLRWELITDGTSKVGAGGTSSDNPVPNLGGSDATFLFRLDLQPLLNYKTAGATETRARKSMHLQFETGVVAVGRTVTAKADPTLSSAGEALVNQGATITSPTKSGPTLTRQRAFTVGSEFSANALIDADGTGAFAELGVVGKGHFDAFLADDRFFEENGVTYVRVPRLTGADAGFFRYELGFRGRVSQLEETAVMKDGDTKGKTASDLLLVEWLYQRADALTGLTVEPGSDSANRWVLRFVATPYLNPKTPGDLKNTKFLLGLEINDDFGAGTKDVRIFYGANVDLKSLFSN